MNNKTYKLEESIRNFMLTGLDLQKKGMYENAINFFDRVIKIAPKHYYARLNKGLTHILMGQAVEASKLLHKLHEEHPQKIDVLRLCGKSYWMLNQYELAIKFLKRVIKLDPNNLETWLDLSALFSANSQNTESLYFATHALSLNPTDPRVHLNLGCALSAMGRMDDANYCFETVLKMSPNNVSALTNIALILEKRGEIDATLNYLDKALRMTPNGTEEEAGLLYSKSYPLLAKGKLKEGWEMYSYGFTPNNKLSRAPKRKFNVPLWKGDPIQGKKLLIWREQGLGDELMFSHIIPETFYFCDDIVIECEERLINLFQRSFPTCQIRSQSFDILSGLSPNDDFDFHIPMGNLPQLFRSDIASFNRGKPYLVPDSNRLNDFSHRISPYKDKRVIGICWRSGVVNADRSLQYAPLSSWKPIFDLHDTVFVNLQYGDCAHEIKQVRDFFGTEIIEWSDLDLRNDLDGVAALISNLDCVVSVGTAVAQLTGALGKHLILMTSRDWTLFGKDYYPWFGNNKIFISDFNQSIEPLIPQVAEYLEYFKQ